MYLLVWFTNSIAWKETSDKEEAMDFLQRQQPYHWLFWREQGKLAREIVKIEQIKES